MKPKHSFFDSKGNLWVACSECNRGGNGSDPNPCAAGWKVKRGGKIGCFCGTLVDKFDEKPSTAKRK